MFLLFFSDDQNLQMSKDKGTQTCMETGEKAKNVEFRYIYIYLLSHLQITIKSKQNNYANETKFSHSNQRKNPILVNTYDKTITKRKHINMFVLYVI